MKKNYLLIAVAMVAALSIVSCKNNKKTQSQEPTQEEVQEMKQALADSVLTKIDAFAEEYIDHKNDGFIFSRFILTEAEKLVKPDYLLDPSVANNLVTEYQKKNALAIYIVEYAVRTIYDMPLSETKEAIAKLALDVNHPVDIDKYDGITPPSEIIRAEYDRCKENDDVASFWQFQYALLVESGYIIANNIDLFYDKISESEELASNEAWIDVLNAIEELAKYDDEMSELNTFILEHRIAKTPEQLISLYSDWETSKQTHLTNRDKIIDRRNALLQ